MTSTQAPPATRTASTVCQKCRRGGGRDRSLDTAIAALFTATPLTVCDRCWHASGGSDAVQAQIVDGGHVEITLVGSAEVEALLADALEDDSRHPIDRLLISSGIRWAVLRHIAAPARCDLVRWVLERSPRPDTRAASSPETWMDAVTDRIHEQSGTEFRYDCKRRRWRAIANVFRLCGQRDGRPLTWISQEEIAAAVGCSARTVRRCVVWLQREGLLHEVLPGCQLPCQSRPDDETPPERQSRLARYAAAIAAEEAAIARARAELDTIRPNHNAVTEGVAPPLADPDDSVDPATGEWPGDGLIQLVPVYELRVPLPAQEQTEEAGITLLRAEAALNAAAAASPLTSTNTAASGPAPENVHPPQVVPTSTLQSRTGHPVDNRPASPGTHQKRLGEPVRAAQWLLSSRLHPDLCTGVSQRWLAALIRSSRLLSEHEWSWDDLADLLHGVPDYPNLPRWIRNPRGWIRARFGLAIAHLSPTKLALIQQVERTSPHLRQRNAAESAAARRADIAALRAAIDACPFCDELGWHDLDPTGCSPELRRCNHDGATGGW